VARRGDLSQALLCAFVLAGYGNGFSALAPAAPARWRGAVAVGGPLGLLALAVGWHRWGDRRPLAALGLHRQDWRNGVVCGSVAGAALAVPPVLWLKWPRSAPVHVAEVDAETPRTLLVRVLVTTPVLVALVEEVAFRGLLQGKLQRAMPDRPAAVLVLSNLAFAAWHVTVNLRTLRATNVLSAGLASLPRALAAGLLAVFAGGVVFGALRRGTGALVAPVLAHWLVDALLLMALYRWRGRDEVARRGAPAPG
jgi:membrane protease YdiL (CAAX protease family)